MNLEDVCISEQDDADPTTVSANAFTMRLEQGGNLVVLTMNEWEELLKVMGAEAEITRYRNCAKSLQETLAQERQEWQEVKEQMGAAVCAVEQGVSLSPGEREEIFVNLDRVWYNTTVAGVRDGISDAAQHLRVLAGESFAQGLDAKAKALRDTAGLLEDYRKAKVEKAKENDLEGYDVAWERVKELLGAEN